MSAIGTFLGGIATKVGAELVGRVVGDRMGPAGGALAGQVVTTVASKLGVPPSELPSQPVARVEKAVRETEAEMPEMIELWSRGLDHQFALHKAELQEGWFAWAWRPGWMYLLGLMWLCRLLILPIVDAMTQTSIASAIDISVMLTLTGYFLALYMGGHTLKDLGTKAIDAYRSR